MAMAGYGKQVFVYRKWVNRVRIWNSAVLIRIRKATTGCGVPCWAPYLVHFVERLSMMHWYTQERTVFSTKGYNVFSVILFHWLIFFLPGFDTDVYRYPYQAKFEIQQWLIGDRGLLWHVLAHLTVSKIAVWKGPENVSFTLRRIFVSVIPCRIIAWFISTSAVRFLAGRFVQHSCWFF